MPWETVKAIKRDQFVEAIIAFKCKFAGYMW